MMSLNFIPTSSDMTSNSSDMTSRPSGLTPTSFGVSSASYDSCDGMEGVRKKVFQNLVHLKQHQDLLVRNMRDFEAPAEVSRRFQKNLKTVLKGEESRKEGGRTKRGKEEEEEEEEGEEDGVSRSASSCYGPMDEPIDLEIFEPFDQVSSFSGSIQARKKEEEEEEEDEALVRRMKVVLWKVAHKKMKKGEWLKLAEHWQFPEAHIQAIKYPDCKCGWWLEEGWVKGGGRKRGGWKGGWKGVGGRGWVEGGGWKGGGWKGVGGRGWVGEKLW